MSDKITNSPQIRFAGFTDAWEQCKLGDYIIPYNKVTTQNNQYPVFTSSRKGLFFQKDYYDNNQIASEDNTGYNIVPRGYFTYRHMSDDLVFKFNINHLAENGIVSTLYPVFTTTESLDSRYLQYQLNEGEEFKRFAILQKQGGSRTYMYLSKLENMTLTMPKLDEQIKIGNFFKQLDDTITLHQRTLELLKDTKKSLLQKMFPKDGANVPEIRFAGFTDPWERCELGEITLKIGSGKTPKGGKSSYVLEGIPLLRSQNVYDDLIDLNDVAYITPQTDEEMKNSRVVKNDVLLNITGASIGRSAVYRDSSPANVNQHVCIIRPVEGYSSDFIQLNLTSPNGQQQIDNNQAGSGREGLNFQQIRKMSFTFPSIEEQDQISAVFKKLDYLITLHQRELNSLKNLKKSLLQQMFI
ncbi:restriction endonuclease subunit S [Bacillus sp. FSL R5-0560]|uniref:restriction endonuclease subunit S n=1 Tax=Bacillus sp. FSL R5-0560 TaxID=2954588 RepID=UPI0030D4653B